MRVFKTFVLLFSFLLFVQQSGFSLIYCKIKGRVIDEESGMGIPKVNVNAHFFMHDSPKEYYVLTDNDGYFTFSNLRPGRYTLNYYPPYPHVVVPMREIDSVDMERSFILKEGEVKTVIKKLKKGGKVIINMKSSIASISHYYVNKYYLDRIEGTSLMNDIRVIGKIKPGIESELDGLATGEYILCASLKKSAGYYTGNDFDFAGIVKVFNLEKLEIKKLDIDYNSNSVLIFNVKDKDNNVLYSSILSLYRKININGRILYYKVWQLSYDPIFEAKSIYPIVVEPGSYLIKISGEIKGPDGKDIHYKRNFFFVDAEPNKEKHLDLVVDPSREDTPDGIDFYHY